MATAMDILPYFVFIALLLYVAEAEIKGSSKLFILLPCAAACAIQNFLLALQQQIKFFQKRDFT